MDESGEPPNNKNVSLSLLAEYGSSDSESEVETPSAEPGPNEEDMEINEMVLKNNIINACAHGPLVKSNSRQQEEGTKHMIIDSNESAVVEYEVTDYRDVESVSDSSDSDSSDSDVESIRDVEELSDSDNDTGTSGKVEQPKVIGELGLDDLPPIEELAISLPSQECTKIGVISSIVDRLVVVRALPATPAVDIDSVLFLEEGARPLGKVFDVFGQVTEPHYCVRFNSATQAAERAAPGAAVYVAPRSEHTSFVFLSELMKLKGSDASWLNDIEPPPQHVEYSDDEDERRARRARRPDPPRPAPRAEPRPARRAAAPRAPRPPRPPRPHPVYPRFGRPWPTSPEPRAQHVFPPPYDPSRPPPFMTHQFGQSPRLGFFRGPCPPWADPPPPGT